MATARETQIRLVVAKAAAQVVVLGHRGARLEKADPLLPGALAAPSSAGAEAPEQMDPAARTAAKAIDFQGLQVFIDRPAGYVQRGMDPEGEDWSRVYHVDYGYLPSTAGGDGDELDVFMGLDASATEAFWIVQKKPDGTFDEYKLMLGFRDADTAKAMYLAHVPKRFFGSICATTLGMVKALLGRHPDEVMKALSGFVLREPDAVAKVGEDDEAEPGDEEPGEAPESTGAVANLAGRDTAEMLLMFGPPGQWPAAEPAPDDGTIVDGPMLSVEDAARMGALWETLDTATQIAVAGASQRFFEEGGEALDDEAFDLAERLSSVALAKGFVPKRDGNGKFSGGGGSGGKKPAKDKPSAFAKEPASPKAAHAGVASKKAKKLDDGDTTASTPASKRAAADAHKAAGEKWASVHAERKAVQVAHAVKNDKQAAYYAASRDAWNAKAKEAETIHGKNSPEATKARANAAQADGMHARAAKDVAEAMKPSPGMIKAAAMARTHQERAESLNAAAPKPAAPAKPAAPVKPRHEGLAAQQAGERFQSPGGVYFNNSPPKPYVPRATPKKSLNGDKEVALKAVSGGEQRYALGVVLEPDVVDAQGDVYDVETIRHAMWDYMKRYQNVGLQHTRLVNGRAHLIECYQAPCEMMVAGTAIKAGTWLMGLHFEDDALWADVQAGKLTGLSIGGFAKKNRV
jgi:Putative phage serine protease XkdF/Inorganic Pyrophosphatase